MSTKILDNARDRSTVPKKGAFFRLPPDVLEVLRLGAQAGIGTQDQIISYCLDKYLDDGAISHLNRLESEKRTEALSELRKLVADRHGSIRRFDNNQATSVTRGGESAAVARASRLVAPDKKKDR